MVWRITLKDALAGRCGNPERTFVVLPDGGRFRVDQLTPQQLDTTVGTMVDLDAEGISMLDLTRRHRIGRGGTVRRK